MNYESENYFKICEYKYYIDSLNWAKGKMPESERLKLIDEFLDRINSLK